MVIWGWNPDIDPNFILGVFTTAQIGSWSDCFWSGSGVRRALRRTGAHDRSRGPQADRRSHAADPLHTEPVHRPGLPGESGGLRRREVARVGPLAGENRVGVLRDRDQQYRFLQPKAGAVQPHGSSAGLIAAIATATVVVVLSAGWALRRRHRASEQSAKRRSSPGRTSGRRADGSGRHARQLQIR